MAIYLYKENVDVILHFFTIPFNVENFLFALSGKGNCLRKRKKIGMEVCFYPNKEIRSEEGKLQPDYTHVRLDLL